jgi:uncharacterized protein (TIGR02270 family)
MNAAVVNQDKLAKAYREIYERYAVDASFLWILRSVAINQPNYLSHDIVELEQRIEACLDGLTSAPEDAWEICSEAMESGDPGDIFVAAILAFRSLEATKVQQIVEVGLADEHGAKGLVSALGWLPGRLVHSWIKKFLTSKDFNHKFLAVAVCSVRREDPLEHLTKFFQREDCIAHEKLYARSLRLVGELKRIDLMPALRIAMSSDQPEILFWATWSAIMLGDKSVVTNLQPFALAPCEHQRKTLELAFRVLPLEDARKWVGLLAQDPAQIRQAINATATLGDPHAINWLINQMRIPTLTRLAGEAFTTITGIDLEENALAIADLPDLDNQLPNDDIEDDNVDMDEDERLPFPEVDKVAAVWQKYQQRFVSGQRYFMGKQINAEHLTHIFKNGNQRQRARAALELALLESPQYLLNHSARGFNNL